MSDQNDHMDVENEAEILKDLDVFMKTLDFDQFNTPMKKKKKKSVSKVGSEAKSSLSEKGKDLKGKKSNHTVKSNDVKELNKEYDRPKRPKISENIDVNEDLKNSRKSKIKVPSNNREPNKKSKPFKRKNTSVLQRGDTDLAARLEQKSGGKAMVKKTTSPRITNQGSTNTKKPINMKKLTNLRNNKRDLSPGGKSSAVKRRKYGFDIQKLGNILSGNNDFSHKSKNNNSLNLNVNNTGRRKHDFKNKGGRSDNNSLRDKQKSERIVFNSPANVSLNKTKYRKDEENSDTGLFEPATTMKKKKRIRQKRKKKQIESVAETETDISSDMQLKKDKNKIIKKFKSNEKLSEDVENISGKNDRLSKPKKKNRKNGSETLLNNSKQTEKDCIDKLHKPINSEFNMDERKDKMQNKNSSKNIRNRKKGEGGDQKPKSDLEIWTEELSKQVKSAAFRLVNEELYTGNIGSSADVFKNDPESFKLYHEGYTSQVEKWPIDPLKLIQRWIVKKPRTWVIADFGCGDARLSKMIPNKNVHNLDLVAANHSVTACDMANTPLKSGTIDVVVFCLSLMGTDVSQYITEANRVLRVGGYLKIAEVESRFKELKDFVRAVERAGFKSSFINTKQKYFFLFDFVKAKDTKLSGVKNILLKPCTYKKR